MAERFWSKVNKRGPDECWEWKASRFPFGYGQILVEGKKVNTHRLAWELANGPIPAGQWVLHRCDNPPCVNPAHLFLGSNADNMRDMASKQRAASTRKTHCPQGHEYTAANTYRSPTRRARQCRTCMRDRDRARRSSSTPCARAA